MAINKKAKASEAEKTDVVTYDIKVTRAKDFTKDDKTAIAFDMIVNGITIYNCWYLECVKDDKPYEMISFPSRKDESSGKYYNHVFFHINAKMTEDIAKQIEQLL